MNDKATATEHLWEQLSGKLRSFLLQRVSDPEVADDLLQETFLRVHTKLDEMKDFRRMTAWVYQVARNLVVDHYRAEGRNLVDTVLEEIAPPLDDSTTGAPTNLNVQVEGWLEPMIDRLPDDYRVAVKQYELEGKPQRALAEDLGLSLSGAKSRVQRGRTKLKGLFQACCSFEQDRRGSIIDYTPRANETGRGCCQEESNS